MSIWYLFNSYITCKMISNPQNTLWKNEYEMNEKILDCLKDFKQDVNIYTINSKIK